ncbi:MAG: zinc-binding dehydrogenase [Spirochaetales bacterium]|nr:zinc-binding dehydrogenase [Spirochaetales bacterium]
MKRIIVRNKNKISYEDVNTHTPEAGSVRVRVHYAGVGFADLMASKGKYQLAPKSPFSPGYECSGVVESSSRPDLSKGTKVACMLPQMGCYQEMIDVDPQWLVPLPKDMDLKKAAALPLNYITASALIEKCSHLKRGDSFFLHGLAGGVGTAAMEIARHRGLKAYGTASRGKHDFVRSQGGIPYDYKDPDWVKKFLSQVPSGVDASFDAMGSYSLNKSWKVLSPTGTLVAYGFFKDSESATAETLKSLLNLLGKKITSRSRNIAICGTPAIIKKDNSWYRNSMEDLITLLKEEKIDPEIFDIVKAENYGKAFNLLEQKKVRGKVLLEF